MNTTIKTLRVIPQLISGVLSAIAILTIYPERTRQREIAAAKRNIAERKAQIANRAAAIEAELVELKRTLATPTPEVIPAAVTAPQPELSNPWETETEIIPDAMPAAGVAIATTTPAKTQLCLPAAPKLPESATKAKTTAKSKATKSKRRSTTAKIN
jgi:hypothetical protein